MQLLVSCLGYLDCLLLQQVGDVRPKEKNGGQLKFAILVLFVRWFNSLQDGTITFLIPLNHVTVTKMQSILNASTGEYVGQIV